MKKPNCLELYSRWDQGNKLPPANKHTHMIKAAIWRSAAVLKDRRGCVICLLQRSVVCFWWFRRDLVFTVCHTSHQSDWSDVCLYLKTYKCIFKHGNRFTHSDSSMECTNTPTHTHRVSFEYKKACGLVPLCNIDQADSQCLIHKAGFIRLP